MVRIHHKAVADMKIKFGSHFKIFAQIIETCVSGVTWDLELF